VDERTRRERLTIPELVRRLLDREFRRDEPDEEE
jgi:hypothetical protein